MPVNPTYPGVYIEEIPSGVRTVTGVSTSIAAFVGYAPQGPLNKAVRIFNFGDYERNFGGLHRDSEISYAIQQFFLNGGTDAYVVRVAEGGTQASCSLSDSSSANILNVKAANAGAWGNDLHLAVDYGPAQLPLASAFNLEVSRQTKQGKAPAPAIVETERYLNLSLNSQSPRYVVDVLKASKLIQVALADGLTFSGAGYALSGKLDDADLATAWENQQKGAIALQVDGGQPVTVTIFDKTAATPINPPTTIAALITAISAEIAKTELNSKVTASATDDKGTADSGNYLKLTSSTPGQTSAVQIVPAAADDISSTLKLGVANGGQEVDGAAAQRPKTIPDVPLTGGTDGTPPLTPSAILGSYAQKQGMYALRDVDLFNLLIIPRTAQFNDSAANAVIQEAVKFCGDERAFYIIDPPAGNTPDTIKDWAPVATKDKNAAVYFPRIQVADPLQEFRLRDMPASGAIAGIFARTDSERGVWKAPAGIDAVVRGAQGLTYTLTDPENGTLNPLGINCLRTFPVYGTIVWGARTRNGADQDASEWKYIPVRRLTLFLQESLYRGTQWVVFEPNDEPLWSQIRLNLGAFMNNLFRQGAFQGKTPKEAYFVKCDSETTTQNDINLGIVNIVVGFAPLKPAEFVIIKFQQMAGQIAT